MSEIYANPDAKGAYEIDPKKYGMVKIYAFRKI
jgi:hypothetical protein